MKLIIRFFSTRSGSVDSECDGDSERNRLQNPFSYHLGQINISRNKAGSFCHFINRAL